METALTMQNINQPIAQSPRSTRQAERAAQNLIDLVHSPTEIVEQYPV